MNLLLLSLALLGCLATTVSTAYGPMKGKGCTWFGCVTGKREAAEEIVEKRETGVVAKREICLTVTGCICKADGTCWYTERCNPPIKVGYCPQNGNKREAAEEIVEKRETDVVEKRETDEGVNENGEVEAVEKREASETRCKTGKPSCECTNGHGCFYTNGCLRRKVPHCPWLGKSHEAVKRVEKSEVVEKPAAKSCSKGCICSGFWIERCDYCEDCKCRKGSVCHFDVSQSSPLPHTL